MSALDCSQSQVTFRSKKKAQLRDLLYSVVGGRERASEAYSHMVGCGFGCFILLLLCCFLQVLTFISVVSHLVTEPSLNLPLT